RSLPLGWSARVSTALTPNAAHFSMMSVLSVATTVRIAVLFMARCATRTTMGAPLMSARGLLGRRVDARRAGMRTVKLMRTRFQQPSQAKLLIGQGTRFVFQQHGQPVPHRV